MKLWYYVAVISTILTVIACDVIGKEMSTAEVTTDMAKDSMAHLTATTLAEIDVGAKDEGEDLKRSTRQLRGFGFGRRGRFFGGGRGFYRPRPFFRPPPRPFFRPPFYGGGGFFRPPLRPPFYGGGFYRPPPPPFFGGGFRPPPPPFFGGGFRPPPPPPPFFYG